MASKQKGAASDNSALIPLAVTAVGVMTVMAAFVALIVAGINAGDFFGGGTAADQGVWQATLAWANPLGIVGLAILFGGSVILALNNIFGHIRYRRDSMANGIPKILARRQA